MEKFIVGILIIAQLLLSQIQYIVGKLRTPEGFYYLGSVHWPSDYFYYLSQFIQGREHWLSSTMLYTSEVLKPVFVGWQHVLAGKILLTLGFDVITSYQIAVVGFLAFFLIVSYRLLRELLPESKFKRILAFVFFLTATPFLKIIKTPSGWDISYYWWWYNLGISVSRFGPTPHHLLAYGLGALQLLNLTWWLKKKYSQGRLSVVMVVVSLLLASISPIHWGLTVISSIGIPVALFIKKGKQRVMVLPRIFFPAFMIIAGGIPSALYALHVFSIPPYDLSAAWERGQYVYINLWQLLQGNGLVVPFALIGLIPIVKQPRRWYLPTFIYLTFAAIMYISTIPKALSLANVRFWPSTVYVGISFLAVEGVWWLSKEGKRKIIMVLLLLIYVVSLIPSYFAIYRDVLKSEVGNAYYYIPIDAYKSYKEAEKVSKPGDVFLVQWPFNESFPALTGRKSLFGFELFTINHGEKMRDAFSIIDGKLDQQQARRVIDRYGVDYVMVYTNNEYVRKLPLLKAIYQNNFFTLYQVIR